MLDILLNGMQDPWWVDFLQGIWCWVMDVLGVEQSYC